ncbi:MAG TPA: hypothetical protein VEC37_01080 [Bacillota bacterium]|nr:hypothetical protein [Bacillota bacterium]
MLKKTVIMIVVFTVVVMFVVPINADPSDVVLDQQVTLDIPGSFELVDGDGNHKPEALQVQVKINNYRVGNFQVTGKLEVMQEEGWTAIDLVNLPFQWSPDNNTVALIFNLELIRKKKLTGPFRASVSLRDGAWELPMQVVGVSPRYQWDSIESR